MQPSTTRAPKPPGWLPSPGSWEEAVLSWYEQADLFLPRTPRAPRPRTSFDDQPGQPRPEAPDPR
jgi:hypothetical protein